MKAIRVKDVYPVDTISTANDKGWKRLLDIADTEDEDILFDFDGIVVIEPWNNDVFKKLLGNERVHFKFYCAEKLASTVDAACILGGLKSGRVENVKEVIEKELSKDEKEAIRKSDEILKLVVIDGTTGVIELCKRYDQFASTTTIDAVDIAIDKFKNETGIVKYIIDTGNKFVQQNIIELLASLIDKWARKDVEIAVSCEDRDVKGKIELYRCMAARKGVTNEQRIKTIQNSIEPFTVGMLTKYKSSRAKDEFGRYGKGIPTFCRVAIYQGITGTGDKAVVNFRTFHKDTFVTHEHWALEHDGDNLENMDIEDFSIPVAELGLFNKYLGSRYHFILPIQYDSEDNFRMFAWENDKVVLYNLTLPERIKAVLDDWEIEYNRASIIFSINETIRIRDRNKEITE